MYLTSMYYIVSCVALFISGCIGDNNDLSDNIWPTIAITMLVRNNEFSLPYVLTAMYQQDYPKTKLYIWIKSEENSDNSFIILNTFKNNFGKEYGVLRLDMESSSSDEMVISNEWTIDRFKRIIKLREDALQFGRDKVRADYVFMLDADVVLTETKTLKSLVSKNSAIVAPLLLSDGLYSNFWTNMTNDYLYKWTEEYDMILKRENLGCFAVPLVHSAVLISMKEYNSGQLTYDPYKVSDYSGPNDDIITFAFNARHIGMTLKICNDYLYGFLPVPLEVYDDTLQSEQFLNMKMEALGRALILPVHPNLDTFVKYPRKTKLGLDKIFMINLERRVQRKQLMYQSFNELGIDATTIIAVDGRNIDLSDLRAFSLTLLPVYEDPYHKRPMKTGEVGCFLSHYYVWKEIARTSLRYSLVLEDDVHFVPNFVKRFNQLMQELDQINWDLVYIGRKILLDSKEEAISDHLVIPNYSYWTIGYLISESGARKLINAEPLAKMLPIDEFLPIMYDNHPNKTWKSFFPRRELKAFSATPLLIHPTHYTGDEGYMSDTEDSNVVTTERPELPLVHTHFEL